MSAPPFLLVCLFVLREFTATPMHVARYANVNDHMFSSDSRISAVCFHVFAECVVFSSFVGLKHNRVRVAHSIFVYIAFRALFIYTKLFAIRMTNDAPNDAPDDRPMTNLWLHAACDLFQYGAGRLVGA